MSIAVVCPVCDELFEFESPALGREVECSLCGEVFVVTGLAPLALGYACDLEDEGEFYDEEWPRSSVP